MHERHEPVRRQPGEHLTPERVATGDADNAAEQHGGRRVGPMRRGTRAMTPSRPRTRNIALSGSPQLGGGEATALEPDRERRPG